MLVPVLSDGSAPALNIDFTSGALDGRISFSRAATATYFDSTGLLQTASSGAARFTYDPAALTALGLLIEEARTNLQTQSQLASGWGVANAVLTLNAVVAPDGTSTAATFADNNTNASHILTAPVTSYTSGTTYTLSGFFKAGTNNFIQYTFPAATFGALQYANFNLSLGTVTATGSANTGSGITALPNGWYRVWLTAPATATASASTAPVMITSGSDARVPAYVGTGVTVQVWGQQIEAAPFPLSYIATTTASVTRAADVATIATASFAWADTPAPATFAIDFTTGNDVASNHFLVGGPTSGPAVFLSGTAVKVTQNDIANLASTGAILVANTAYKCAATWGASGDSALSVNGGTVGTSATAFTFAATPTLFIGEKYNATTVADCTFKRIRYWSARLGNAQLQALTL